MGEGVRLGDEGAYAIHLLGNYLFNRIKSNSGKWDVGSA